MPVNNWYLRIGSIMKFGWEMAVVYTFKNNSKDETMITIAADDMKSYAGKLTQKSMRC